MPSSNLDLIDSTRPSLLPLSVDHYTSCSRRTIAGDRWGENWIERNWLGRIFSGQPAEFATEGFAVTLAFNSDVIPDCDACARSVSHVYSVSVSHPQKKEQAILNSSQLKSPETVSLLGGAGDSPQKCDSCYGGLSIRMGLVQRQQEQRYLAPNGSHASKMCLSVLPTFEIEILSWDYALRPLANRREDEDLIIVHSPRRTRTLGVREWPESSSARIE
ncbi:hypothetical protein B0H14DRAFT_2566581 [Mycena olivaceomarginata]|nr:hypothetical protein B0H14DRAFT_2566581 [Mycena olivaceomarginata]